MRVSAIDNTRFGMAVHTTPEAKKILLEQMSLRQTKKFEKLKEIAQNDTVNVNIRTEEMSWGGLRPELTYTQLVVDVGDGSQHSYRPFLNLLKPIKKAVNKAHELSEKQKIFNNI